MSPLEAAKRLAQEEPWYRNRMEEEGCLYCSGGPGDHAPDCPWLALPRIVAALAAAEEMLTTPPRGWDCPYCATGLWDATPVGCALLIGDHAPDCPWQALVAALTGDTDG